MGEAVVVAGREMHHMDSVTLQTSSVEPIGNSFHPLGHVQIAGIEKTFARLTTCHHDGVCSAFKCVHQLKRINTT